MTHSTSPAIYGGLCAAILMGCAVDAAAPEALDLAPFSERAAPTPADPCLDAVHIGRCDANCQSIGAWKGKKLFAKGTPWLKSHGQPLPPALDDFYRFTWDGPGSPTQHQIDNLYGMDQIDEIGPSCVALSPQTGDSLLTEQLGPLLRSVFHANTGRPSSADIDLPATGTADPRVTVMVVDSQPNDLGTVPTSFHGRHMGNIIGDIACPDDVATCRVEVEHVVGLPRVGNGQTNYINGGMVGTHGDLAAAIYEGLRRWDVANGSRPIPSRLVVNLSVGWEPSMFGGNEVDVPPAIQAVRRALRYASCRGALIVAAAGNEGDLCGVTGPLLPGAWEALSAPNELECQALGVASPVVQTGVYQPLVHAVGGRDLDQGPMPGSREEGTPRLVAAASHVVAGDPMHGGLTGTSVGAAVASAAAALVWSYDHDRTASEVMDLVYDGGGMIAGLSADFTTLGTTPYETHMVDACAALELACSLAAVPCPPMPLGCTTVEPPPPDAVAGALASLASKSDDQYSRSLPKTSSSCVDSCGEPVEVRLQAGSTPHCGVFSVDPTEHLVNPTPDSIGCPTCGLQNNVVSLSVHPTYDNSNIETIVLDLTDNTGAPAHYDLGSIVLSSDVHTTVLLDPEDMPEAGIRSGDVTIEFDTGRTTTDALLVF